jgi:hypothetical protein
MAAMRERIDASHKEMVGETEKDEETMACQGTTEARFGK